MTEVSNVYCMVQQSPKNICPWMSGLVWCDSHGEWHPASFGSDIYNKIASTVPKKRDPVDGDRFWLVPDVPACPSEFRARASELVCHSRNQRADFLPDDWRPA